MSAENLRPKPQEGRKAAQIPHVGTYDGTAPTSTRATGMRSMAQDKSSEQGIHSVQNLCILPSNVGNAQI